MKKLVLLAFLLISVSKITSAQSTPPCGFDIVHNKLLLTDSSYRKNVESLNDRWIATSAMMSSAFLTYTSAGYVYEIPMVIHVLHTGGALGTTYNPSDDTIASMISYLNKSYAAVSPFRDTTTSSSTGGGTRIPLKFVLAKRSPTGATTSGIIRINAVAALGTTKGTQYSTYGIQAAMTTGLTVSEIASLSRWPSADYYNVYSVNKIDGNDLTVTGGIAGFAYFPGQPASDGMYVVASQIKSGTTTVSHEFGHAFGLYHTFQGDGTGSTCPTTSPCISTGDLVCDTEPHIRSSSSPGWCPSTDANPCTGGASYNNVTHNIMDYTQCPPDRYTAGQRTRVLATLDDQRTGYKTSSGLLSPYGTIASATCTPTATLPGFPIGPVRVVFNDLNVWTGDNGSENQTYIDHAYNQQTYVKRRSSYTISINTQLNAQNVKAFIDYNNDGDFADVGEEVFSHGYTVSAGDEMHTGSIIIPNTATTCAFLRMRVVSEFGSSTITNWPCGPYVYGQAEDYGVYVISDTPAVTSPVTYTVGATASALSATGTNLKWYTLATGGTGSSTAIIPSTASAGTTIYYVSQSGDGSTQCESDRTPITVVVNAATTTVSPPTVTSPIYYCQGAAAAALTATLASATDTLYWYTVPTGGTGSTTAPTPTTTSAGTTKYYVSEKNTSGVESTRDSIAVIINPGGAAPTFTSPVTYCQDATTAVLSATGTGIKWYTTPTGGTATSTAPTPSSTIPKIITYYLTLTSGLGCETYPRAVFNVVINPKPDSVKATALGATAFCVGDSVILNGSASVFSGFGSTAYLQGSAASGTPFACDCPNGSVVVGYEGSYGSLVDQFRLICKPINRFGVLGSTTSVTTYNGTGSGPVIVSPILFAGTGMMVGIKAIGTDWPSPTDIYSSLGGVTGYGQNQSYIASFGNNSSSPITLSSINGWSSTGDYGSVFTPNGTVSSGMYSFPSYYARGVSLRYTPIGAYKYTYSWSSAPTTDTNSTVTIKTTGSYTLTVTNSLGCSATSPAVNVNVSSYPTNPTVVTPINYCLGATATALTATKSSATDTLKWYNKALVLLSGAPTPSTLAVGADTFYVSQTNIVGCESGKSRVVITVNPLPTISGTLVACVGKTSTLTGSATAHATTPWASSNTAIATVSSTGVVTGVSGGTATITYKNTNGCTQTASFLVNPLPTIGGTLNACVGSSSTLIGSATAHATTPWTSSNTAIATVSSTGVVNGVSLGTVTITYKNNNGCDQTASFTVNPLPTIGGTLNTCIGSSTTLTGSATAHATTPWTSSNTAIATVSSTGVVSGVSAGSVTITYQNTNGCFQTASFTVNPLPTISGALVACVGKTSTLTGSATAHATTPWASSNTAIATVSSTGVVTGVSGGTATITYKNTNGCTQTASFLVNPLPTISGTPYACVGLSSTLTGSASPATTSPWVSSNTSVASVSSTGVVSAIMAGTTNITFTNSNGCSQSITFTVNPNPLAPVVASPLNLCIGSIAVPLSATGTSLKWYLVPIGGVASSSAPIPSTAVVKDSNFYVSQSNTFGCEGPRATLTVSVKALPLVNITSLSASGFVFCRYSSITLKANTTATAYQWSYNGTLKLGAIADTLIADTTGYYRVNVTDVYGCKNKDSVWVLRDSSVVPVLSPTSAHICLEGEQLFTVSPGYVGWSFNWLQSGVPVLPPTPTSNVRSLSAAGTYWVITTNTLGCFDTTNTSSIVNFSMPAKPTIINKAPLLEVANIYRYYQWFRNGVKLIGANVFRYTTTTSGKYYVEVTDGNGCLNNSDTVTIQPSTKISNTAIKETLKIYPNPTNSKVFIDAPINVNVKVTDITGRLVLDAKEVQEIDLSRFADGSYLFLITDAENNIITVEKIDKID